MNSYVDDHVDSLADSLAVSPSEAWLGGISDKDVAEFSMLDVLLFKSGKFTDITNFSLDLELFPYRDTDHLVKTRFNKVIQRVMPLTAAHRGGRISIHE